MFNKGNVRNFIIMGICILLSFALSLGGYMGYDYYSQSKDADSSKVPSVELSPATVDSVEKTSVSDFDEYQDEEKQAMARRFDFDKLAATVPDLYAWIYIPDTHIDYCVVHDKVSSQKYVWSDIYGESSSVGCIFTYDTDEKDMLRVIYGHHLSGPAKMFTELTNYDDYSWARSHPYVYIYYKDRIEKWAVWAPQYVDKTHGVYQYPYYKNESDYESLINTLDSSFGEKYCEKPTSSEHIIVLSTCDSAINGTSGRYIVPLKLQETLSLTEKEKKD